MAVSHFSLECVCFCRIDGRFCFVQRLGQKNWRSTFCDRWSIRRWDVLFVDLARSQANQNLARLRLLAHQSKLLSTARGSAAGDFISRICVVPLGPGAVGIQSTDSAGANVTIGLLGPHRVRLRANFHSASRLYRNSGCIGRTAHNLRRNGFVVHCENEMEIASSFIAKIAKKSKLTQKFDGLLFSPVPVVAVGSSEERTVATIGRFNEFYVRI